MMLTIAHMKAGPLARTYETASSGRAWTALAKILLWPVRALQARQLANTFANMDERDLADIGLTRQDVRDMTGLSIADDPSLFLAERRWRARRDLGHRAARVPAAWR